MINFLRVIWARVSDVLFPEDYYAWQTLIYLGIFSFTMSWVTRLVGGGEITVNLIATAGWVFFALGIGWLLEGVKLPIFGIPVAPWVMGAIVCTYVFGLLPLGWRTGLTVWPIVSVAIAAIPQFLNWELKPKIPPPAMRQNLILLSLIALLFSNWFQFSFRLQDWFEDYPSLLADDFSDSGFVSRVSNFPEEQARGVVLLTSVETEIRGTLNDTPWSYVERWLLNLDERLVNLEVKTIDALEYPKERKLWRLEASPRSLDNNRYGLDLRAFWLGPTAMDEGYFLEKTCIIQPRSPAEPTINEEGETVQPSPVAEVTCDLATPKKPGRPLPVT
ncbi:DUF5357 family protein [Oscillatoria sp. CS-180]|uniref:DUF5357 family protein n=1 Tax=Oscillatoria sp. CS-180 TaxID=3021720 RepID=UPI00232AD21F|nr:DUF5357 family protein [Oscillatoria sp. CS-180]MDB9525313.1 DUF5357 family protein [Oscillatoria sp. CS-180]